MLFLLFRIFPNTGRGGMDYSARLRQTHTRSTDSFHSPGDNLAETQKNKQTNKHKPKFIFHFFSLYFAVINDAGRILSTFTLVLQLLIDNVLFGMCAGGKDVLQGRRSDKGQAEVVS